MNIKFIKGNLLDSTTDIICHQVNCQGKMNSGVAKAIREKYPKVYDEYRNDCILGKGLGQIGLVPISNNRYVCNLFGQDNYGYDGKRYTSYDAVNDGFYKLKVQMLANNLKSLSLPYGMSSIRGGANWEIIYCIICQTFKDTNINIEIWKLE